MDDLISRQDAVNALDKRFDDVPMELTTEILLLRKDLREVIPSATCGNLEKPEKPQHSEGEAADCNLDCIDRQEAIRWVKSECNPYGKPTLDYESGIKVIEHLERMSSVQPEKRTEERTETHACDLIDRQAAINALDVLCQEHRYKIPGKIETYSQYNEAWQDALDRAEGAIFNLPSAQPDLDEWCTDCKEYDSERHCCPRYNRVIREAVEEVKEERIYCKDCKWCEDADGLTCMNPTSWVVDTGCNFGCVLAERREE